MKNKSKLLVVFCASAVLGCSTLDIKIPNVEACVGIELGGYCKKTVTGEERLIEREDIEEMIWDYGAVILTPEAFAEYMKIMEKICNRQDECEHYENGAPKKTLKSFQTLERIRYYDNIDLGINDEY